MPDRTDRPALPARNRRAPLRYVTLGSAALFLGASAYQATFAANRLGANVAHLDGYGGGGGNNDGDDDGGISGGAAAGIAIGVVAIGAGVYYANEKKKGKEEGEATPSSKSKGGDAAVLPALPAGTRAVELRLTPGATDVAAGTSRVFDLQARSKADGKWYSVASRPEASVRLKSASAPLTAVDGTKNVFSVPLDVPGSANGKKVEVVGTFAQAGAPLTADASVNLRVEPVTAR